MFCAIRSCNASHSFNDIFLSIFLAQINSFSGPAQIRPRLKSRTNLSPHPFRQHSGPPTAVTLVPAIPGSNLETCFVTAICPDPGSHLSRIAKALSSCSCVGLSVDICPVLERLGHSEAHNEFGLSCMTVSMCDGILALSPCPSKLQLRLMYSWVKRQKLFYKKLFFQGLADTHDHEYMISRCPVETRRPHGPRHSRSAAYQQNACVMKGINEGFSLARVDLLAELRVNV